MKDFIEAGKAVMGIEFGSTRIKAVLVDDGFKVIAQGAHDWENKLVDGVWSYSLEDVEAGVRDAYAKCVADAAAKYGAQLTKLAALGVSLPVVPAGATNNAHMFYLLFPDLARRSGFIAKMRERGVLAVFHYLPLHSSEFYREYSKTHRPSVPERELPNCDRYADTLVRLPLYCGLAPDQDAVLAAAAESL